jgi:hypothetical protein
VQLVSIATECPPRSEQTELDLLVAACGYESRAVYVSQAFHRMAKRKVALGFDSQQELCYMENRDWFKKQGFELAELSDPGVLDWGRQLMREVSQCASAPNITIDISCLNRLRLADLVTSLQALDVSRATFTFAYNIAEFTEPLKVLGPTSIAEPVTPEFAGWSTAPERPPAAIIGLGYEYSRAVGIIDHLEINNAAWAFTPVSPISNYLASVDTANRSLLEAIRIQGRAVKYDVLDPASLFRELNTLVGGLLELYNPIIIPLGPKIFALCSLLAATLHPELGVWRVSSGILEAPVDRRPSPHTTAVRAVFERR